jgi:AcrR family transcriptional regulator
MARSQEERKAETRTRLLDAAARLFAEQGIDAVSVDAVADAAGRTSGSIYAHFGSKDGLVTAVLDECKDKVAAVVAAAFEAAADLPSRLDGLWANFVDPPDALGDRWLLLEHELWARAVRDPALATQLAARYADARAAMTTRFAEWAADPDEPANLSAPDASATLLLALLLGLEMQRRLDPSVVSDALALDGLLTILGDRSAPSMPGSRSTSTHPDTDTDTDTDTDQAIAEAQP